MTPQERVKSIKTIFTSAIIAAIATALIVTLALFTSPIISAVFSAAPTSLMFFAAAACIFNDINQKNAFDDFLFYVGVIFYLVLTLTTLVWYVVHMHCFKKTTWNRRVWISFGISMIIWTLSSLVMILLYYAGPQSIQIKLKGKMFNKPTIV